MYTYLFTKTIYIYLDSVKRVITLCIYVWLCIYKKNIAVWQYSRRQVVKQNFIQFLISINLHSIVNFLIKNSLKNALWKVYAITTKTSFRNAITI